MSLLASSLSKVDSDNSGRFKIDYRASDKIRLLEHDSTLEADHSANECNHTAITKTDSMDNLIIRMHTDGSLRTNDSQKTIRWEKIKICLHRSGGGYWEG